LTKCSGNAVQIQVGTNTVTCQASQAGQTINVGSSQSLQCPDVANFCQEYNARCPNDCNAHGLCTNGNTCHCYTGWAGSDCSSKVAVDYAAITSGTYFGRLANNLQLSLFLTTLLALIAL
jgi:hypothetical protein